jgi:hypothetical protein
MHVIAPTVSFPDLRLHKYITQYTKMKSSFLRSVTSSKARSPVPSLSPVAYSKFIIDLSTTIADLPSCSRSAACFLFKNKRYKCVRL